MRAAMRARIVEEGNRTLVISLEGVRTLGAFNVHSDRNTLSGPVGPKRKSSTVRMSALRRLDGHLRRPVALRGAAQPQQAHSPRTLFTCAHNSESPARHHSRRANRNSSRHHHHHEAVTHAEYAQAHRCVKPSA